MIMFRCQDLLYEHFRCFTVDMHYFCNENIVIFKLNCIYSGSP